MAVPASKRRKTEHTSSSDDEYSASITSSLEVDHANATTTDETEEEDLQDQGKSASHPSFPNAKSKSESSARSVSGRKSTSQYANAQVGAAGYANGTFKSNAFKMQVDELLEQIRPRHGKRESAVESALHSIKKTIEQLPTSGPTSISEAEQELIRNKVAIPFPTPRPAKDVKYKLSFAKPTNINVVGSFALQTASRSRDGLEVDMVTVMPASIFEDKDFLNYRYFYKRAHYLARLASALKLAHGTEFTFEYRLLHDDPLKPVLALRPAGKRDGASEFVPGPKWQINILPCTSQDQFAAQKLRLDKNCVRHTGTKDSKDSKLDSESHTPTPFFNSSLRSDMLMTVYLKLLHGAAKRCSAFIDTCLLGNTWLRQRGFGSSIAKGGFGNFEWSTLVALSLQGGGPGGRPLLSEGYSSYQLLKATLQLLSTKDFRKKGLMFGNELDLKGSLEGDVPLLWDGDRAHNVLFKMSSGSYSLLRSEARNTMSVLGDRSNDGFDATFILNVKNPLYRFDSITRLPLKSIVKSKEHSTAVAHGSLVRLHEVLKRGLGDRVHLIGLFAPQSTPWGLGSAPPRSEHNTELTIGLMVNPENVKRTVDHGPAAENKAAAASFREFWGEKAELRRFKDGTILESVVWASSEHGSSILEQILRFLLVHHFGVATEQALSHFEQGFGSLVRDVADMSVFNSISTYYKQFENDLRELREMPLSIRQIMPADAQLRFSSIQAPASSRSGRCPFPANVTLQFEGSGRWPDDLFAIQQTKVAFMLKLEEMLRESSDVITTRIGLENEEDRALNQAFLEVTYNAEASFRLRIYHDREQTLFERQLKNPASSPKSKELAAIGLAKYKRDYVKAPAHTQAIARLCSRHPALSGSIRLTKKWFASHLLSNHVADEVIELLVARTFTQPGPWSTPSSSHVGFLRTLFWISRWDWRVDPLIVDLSGSGQVREAEIKAIHTRFEAWRKLDPALNRTVLFAASNVDPDGNTWTAELPAKVVAARMTALAKASCEEIEQHQLQLEPASLFSSSLGDFNFVLHISSDFVGGKSRQAKSATAFKNLELDDISTEDVGLQPVELFLGELQTLYGSAVLFFYGASERPIIAGLWSPLAASRSWKVNLSYSTMPLKIADNGDDADDGVQASLNKTAILSEISRLGGNLITRIDVN